LNGQLPPGFVSVSPWTGQELLQGDGPHLPHGFRNSHSLGLPLRSQQSFHDTKQNCSPYPFSSLVSNDVFRQSLTTIATSPPPQPCFMATSTVPLAPRQLLSKIAARPLAADSAIYAFLSDDQPWAADSASASLGYGDYDCVAGSAGAALLHGERSAATMPRALISSGSTTVSHTPTLEMTVSTRKG